MPRQADRVAADGMVLSRGRMNVISLQLEGRWLPLERVAGKQWSIAQRQKHCQGYPLIMSVMTLVFQSREADSKSPLLHAGNNAWHYLYSRQCQTVQKSC